MTVWLDVPTASALLPHQPTPRHVRRLANEGRFGEVRRDGRELRISLDALPGEAQVRFFAAHPHLLPHPAIVRPPHSQHRYENATASQRQRAERRRDAVLAWLGFLSEWGACRGRAGAKRRWVAGYKATHPEIGKLSLDSIARWTARFEAEGISGLVDGNDGHARRGKTSIPRDALNFFRARYLDKDAPPSIARAIEDTRLAAGEYGWKLPKADDAFYRCAAKIPQAVKLARRDAVDTPSVFLPYVERAADRPYRTLQSDHHIADVFVHCEGQVCGEGKCSSGHRPWWTPMFDVGSRKVISWQISLAVPNAERILRAFRLAVEAEGLPARLYVDNGKDFKKAAGKALRETEEILGNRMRALGVETVFARPYNAQAKAIERFFGTFVSRRWQGTDGYAGRLGKRSERTQHLCKNPELLPRFSEFVGLLDAAITVYNTTSHRGTGMNGRTPSEVFAAGRIQRRDPDAFAFRLVFWDAHDRVLDRNGVRVLNLTYTPADPDGQIFAHYFRERIKVLIDPSDLSKAILCNADEQFLCEARALELATHDTSDTVTLAALEAVQRERKSRRRALATFGGSDAASRGRLRDYRERYGDIFRRFADRRREEERQLVAAVGAETATSVYLRGYSKIARDVETARVPLLSAEERLLASSVDDDETGPFEESHLRLVDSPGDDLEAALGARASEGFCSATTDCPYAHVEGSVFCYRHQKDLD